MVSDDKDDLHSQYAASDSKNELLRQRQIRSVADWQLTSQRLWRET